MVDLLRISALIQFYNHQYDFLRINISYNEIDNILDITIDDSDHDSFYSHYHTYFTANENYMLVINDIIISYLAARK